MMEKIKKLREKTGAPVMEIKKALDEVGGDVKLAENILVKRGEQVAEKKAKAARKKERGPLCSFFHKLNKMLGRFSAPK